jgi:cyclase|tara:strand:- start:431 stop:1174 length:744 start_codon:yes stop_codon:yes gene_type:complete
MRLITRLDIKNEFVIKGIHLEGLRKVGDPNQMAKNYYEQGVDEIVFMDAVASLYDRNNLFEIIEKACEDVFVPIAIGGGIRSTDDVSRALQSGADKVVINTGAVRNIQLVEDIAKQFGSQCIVCSIEAKKFGENWKAYIDNGREPTDHDVIQWAQTLQEAGAGELLITSVDKEGTMRGFDTDLVKNINDSVNLPVIVSGGYGKSTDLEDLLDETQPSAVAFASVLHYKKSNINELRSIISQNTEVIK